ncbi:MAG: hypothetical protein QG657_36 [Acidobacteriota bacterium]|nr:hypothetical protein [Acidobacteriota bacterium]
MIKRMMSLIKALYYRWLDFWYWKRVKRNALTAVEISAMEREIESFGYKPLVSVVMTVYNIDREWLERAIESVLAQVYGNWELCVVDDASPKPHVKEILRKYAGLDKRVKVKFLEGNLGMSGASNEALGLSSGEYVAFLDHDDELSRDSLYEVVKLLSRESGVGVIFSDEDKLTLDGKRLRPVYKPGWDPELFLTYNYLCHLVVCRRDLVLKVGGFRKGFEGAQDYDLLLQVIEVTDRVIHIPKVLYHWRMAPGSAAFVVDAKKEAFEKSKQALRDAMERRGIAAEVIDGKRIGTFKVVPK